MWLRTKNPGIISYDFLWNWNYYFRRNALFRWIQVHSSQGCCLPSIHTYTFGTDKRRAFERKRFSFLCSSRILNFAACAMFRTKSRSFDFKSNTKAIWCALCCLIKWTSLASKCNHFGFWVQTSVSHWKREENVRLNLKFLSRLSTFKTEWKSVEPFETFGHCSIMRPLFLPFLSTWRKAMHLQSVENKYFVFCKEKKKIFKENKWGKKCLSTVFPYDLWRNLCSNSFLICLNGVKVIAIVSTMFVPCSYRFFLLDSMTDEFLRKRSNKRLES